MERILMQPNTFIISQATVVITDHPELPILKNATSLLQRDIRKVTTTSGPSNEIYLHQIVSEAGDLTDEFSVQYINEHRIEITATTQLGLMYGALAISREILKIDDFWYFTDTPVVKHKIINWTNFKQKLPDFQTKYRGWFVNDELLLTGWQDHDSNEYVWERIYETLLRAGGNLIVPGTDKESRFHHDSAQAMGLIIAHHHAEPLGAEMFARVYPNLEASYLKYPRLFEQLWRESILTQRGKPVLYGLGFRGQGDRPFWLEDPNRTWSDKEKATVINDVIKLQYDMVCELDPGAQCSVSIYGELTELFNKGLIHLPDDVIEIWADSGYGKMVSRRQDNNNPRSSILEISNLENRPRGIYYHITFHDLQASNFLTLLPNDPGFVSAELAKVRDAQMDTLELINVGNIKPHILFIREIARSWRKDYSVQTTTQIISEYVGHYYSDSQVAITSIYQGYFKAIIQYGMHEDEKAGDEFAAYTLRKIITAWIRQDSQLLSMEWLTGDVELENQLEQIKLLIRPKLLDWVNLYKEAIKVAITLKDQDEKLFYNDILLSIITHNKLLEALNFTIKAFEDYHRLNIVQSFLEVDNAVQANDKIIQARYNNPSPKWIDFYQNDAYTNIELNAKKLRVLRSYLRTMGDGSDEDQWERKYLMETIDSRVMLLSNTHLALSDEQLAKKLREQLIDEN